MRRTLPREAWWVAGALLLAACLRLHAVGRHGLWQDEIGSVVLAEDPARIDDPLVGHGPLYFRLLALWLQHGRSEAWIRSLSVIAGVLSVLVLHAAVRRSLGSRVALAAAWLTCLSPVQVWVSREARPYVLMNLFALLAFAAWDRGRSSGRWRWWIAFGVAAAAALYAHYFAIFALATLGASTALDLARRSSAQPRRLMLGFLLGTGVAVLLFLPRLHVFVTGQQALGAYASQVKAFATRHTFPAKTAVVLLARSDPPHLVGGALEALLPSRRFTGLSALVLAGLLWASARQAARGRLGATLAPWLLMAAGPVLLAVAANTWRDAFLDARYLTLTSVFLSVPAAVAAEALGRMGRVVAAVATLGLALLALQPLYRRPTSEIREATRYIDARSRDGDCVGVVTNKAFCYRYYSQAPRPAFDLPSEIPSLRRHLDSTVPLAERAVRPEDVPAITAHFARCRATFLLYNEEVLWGVDMGASVLRDGMAAAGFRLLEERRFSDTRVESYAPPSPGDDAVPPS